MYMYMYMYNVHMLSQEAMQFKVASLQHQLSESVSATELDKASRQYTELATKHQAMLRKKTHQDVEEQQVVERLQVHVHVHIP